MDRRVEGGREREERRLWRGGEGREAQATTIAQHKGPFFRVGGGSVMGWRTGWVLKKGFSHGHQAHTRVPSACCRLEIRQSARYQESRFEPEELPLGRRNGGVQRQRVPAGGRLVPASSALQVLVLVVCVCFCRLDPGPQMCSANPTIELHPRPKVQAPCLILTVSDPTIATPV